MNKKVLTGKTKVILVITFLILFISFICISYRVNFLEYLEIGPEFVEIFNNNYKYQISIILINFLIIFISMYITTKFIKKGLKKFFNEEKKEVPKLPNKSVSFIVAGIVSIITTPMLKEKIITLINSALFGEYDPIFNTDIGFFVFQKPCIETLLYYAIGIFVLLTIYTVIYYIYVFNKYFDGIDPEVLKKNTFIKQIKFYIMAVIIIIAGLILIKTQGVVLQENITLNDENSTKIVGAGMTDANIKVWGYRGLALIIIISVYLALKAFKNESSKKALISLGIVPAYLVCLFIVMLGFQLIFVNPNKLDKEKNYISYNIENTKTAYNINIEEIEKDYSGTVTLEEINENRDVISNIAIVNEDITLRTLSSLQTNTGYYQYNNTRLGKYEIDGEDSLIYISPREIVNDSRTYNNKTYEYTHGFGAIITYGTKVDENGNIEYIQKDFEDLQNGIEITQPRIYFGLETNSTIITNTKNKSEFDYPVTSTTNAQNTYDGEAGLNLGFLDRLVLGISKKDLSLAFSTNVTKDSKILINRNIRERAKVILPNLLYDENPYLVVTDEGRLVWVIDAYTISNQYPYSQKTIIEYEGYRQEINYIRNSVKVLVDAYDGTMRFYITDKTDPIAMLYNNTYPSLFIDGDLIPEDISSHFVYPEFLYKIQSEVLKNYHNITADVLYRGDDIWDNATYATSNTSIVGTKMELYHTMINTENGNNIGTIFPYTIKDKQNINAYLVGYSNGKDNVLKLYKFKSGSNVLGPMQLDKQIEQDETISKEIENINVTGTKMIKNILIVPINNTLIYVEPIYTQALNEQNSVPVLKKIVVASGSKLAIGNTLEEALEDLVSQYAVNIEVENTDTIEDLIESIIKANSNLKESSDTNDWEMMGKDIKKLQELIDKLEELNEQEKEESEELENESQDLNNTVNTVENVTY